MSLQTKQIDSASDLSSYSIEGHMNSNDKLKLDAFVAISGADFVRQRLLHGLSIGNPSLEAEAYMIKSRVKGVDSLMTKVVERQEVRPGYSAADATDIVGLRILCLFRNELPVLVRRFLNFLEWSQKNPYFLFSGEKIKDCIKEIIIYPTSDIHDTYIDLCITEFSSFQLFQKNDLRYTEGPSVEIDRKDSRYSSIHIVLDANGPNLDLGEQVPVEVQIRTSIEDVWGEIDHRLRYKLRQKEKESSEISGESNGKQVEREVAEYLRALKKSLDASSEMAGIIDSKIKSLDFARHPLQSSSNNISIGLKSIASLPVPESHRDVSNEIMELLSACYEGVSSLRAEKGAPHVRSLLDQFDIAQRRIDSLLSDTSFTMRLRGRNRDRVLFHFTMERALAYYWMASLVRSLKSGYQGNLVEAQALEFIRISLSLYQSASATPGYSENPILSFRVGAILDLKGDHELARSKYGEAVSLLESDFNLSEGSYFRSRIPVQYAISLWQSAENLKRRSTEFGGLSLVEGQRRALYLEALEITRRLLDAPTIDPDLDDWPVSWTDQYTNVQNNILDFALCYLSSGGTEAELAERGMDRATIGELLGALMPDGVASIANVTFADTVRAAAKYLGDIDLNDAAAHKVLELIDGKDFGLSLPDIAYREMRFDALRDIEYNKKRK